MDAYEVCISNLQKAQSRRCISSLKKISPMNFITEAEEMAQTFRQRIAQVEAMARADMLRQSGLTIKDDEILGPFTSYFPEEGLDLSELWRRCV
ncbi:hypothetical protein JHK82_050930 [Glycine max]|nr:hypothetical protein JHK82_050930 [Glycine max]